ncbi:cupin domain-containing protein [Lachnoclostridium phytofermentans]|uniref:Ethanolamine utilisation EutQ family protein n=1 Tax=Lachnoclostridium phytofermentans (strain ATCC 700394 / DSM 18823 / ISDg) TaxID=357809 RepID=A9KMY4_LACP7|nr:cupin domain-containing protein [Lachnoclostridium phytofermentans]ABX42995.1 Ethanolamine utilisation EutQ family protein [Lachnoclostridium phytofermentans ISDg]
MEVNRSTIEDMIREILMEKLKGGAADLSKNKLKEGIISVKLPSIRVSQNDLMDTGKPGDVVYTKDLFSLEESPRLGCGIMEMKETTFDWTLNYDEIDYVIEGTLNIVINGKTATANAGELVLIPKGSSIKFSVPNYARFIYVTYPADWANQA